MQAKDKALSAAFRAILQSNNYQDPCDELIALLVAAVPAAKRTLTDAGIFYHHGFLDEARIVDAQECLLDAHLNLPDDVCFKIVLSSPTASPFAALAMIGIIQQLRTEGRYVQTHATGLVTVPGLAVIQAAEHRTIAPDAVVFFSRPLQTETDAVAAVMEERYFSILSGRTGTSPDEYRAICEGPRRTITATDALKARLFDDISDALTPLKRRNGESLTSLPRVAIRTRQK